MYNMIALACGPKNDEGKEQAVCRMKCTI
jgi:hypothetical protein